MHLPFTFKKKILILILSLFPVTLAYNIAPYYVLWDVGQGQWLSRIDSFQCLHIDIGGESFPKKIKSHCAWQKHSYWISHWDWDHYRYLNKMKSLFSMKEHTFSKYDILFSSQKKRLSKNDRSKVLQLNSLLVPGDSTKKMEEIWSKRIQRPVEIFILGHHGSNTSNHTQLLETIYKTVKQCLCSARKKKYGHPHPKVKKRLKLYKCPLICTENWGHLKFRNLKSKS